MWIFIALAALIVLAALVLAVIKSPAAVGHISEIIVRVKLKLHAKKPEKVLSNLYLPKPDGSTAEIDILFITRQGIIVVENKHYAGYIFGTDTDLHWTVTYKRQSETGKSRVKKIRICHKINQAVGRIM